MLIFPLSIPASQMNHIGKKITSSLKLFKSASDLAISLAQEVAIIFKKNFLNVKLVNSLKCDSDTTGQVALNYHEEVVLFTIEKALLYFINIKTNISHFNPVFYVQMIKSTW